MKRFLSGKGSLNTNMWASDSDRSENV